MAECGRLDWKPAEPDPLCSVWATSWQWKQESKRILAVGFALSAFCELLQYLTGRGMADVNDVLFNTLGAAVGVWLARRTA